MNSFVIRSVAPVGHCLFLGPRGNATSDQQAMRHALESGGWAVLESGASLALPEGKGLELALIENAAAIPSDLFKLLKESGTLIVFLGDPGALAREMLAQVDLFICPVPGQTGPLRALGKPAHFVAPGWDSADRKREVVERHWKYRKEKDRFARVDWSRISYGHTVIPKGEVGDHLARSWQSAEIPARQRALVQAELADLYQGRPQRLFQVLADALKPYVSTGTGVLEIGCASGYYYEILEYLLNRRIAYVGVDYSRALIAMARSFYPRTPFLAADGGRLPFRDRAFHVVVSSGVLLHVPDYLNHIRETVRVAGAVVVGHRIPLCRKRPTTYHRKFAYGVETVELVFNEEEILAAFRKEGMGPVKMTEFSADEAKDEYHATYVFERVAAQAPSGEPAPSGRTIEDLVAAGEKAFAAGEMDSARALFREARAAAPGHPRLVNNLGVMACGEGDWPEAERLFEAAHAGDPRNRRFLMNLAEVLIALEKPSRAAAVLDAYLRDVGGDEEIRGLREEIPDVPAPAAPSDSGGRGAAAADPGPPTVLWQNRDDMEAAPGGDTTVVHEITRNLLDLGVPVRLSLAENPDLGGIDVVQLNNISRTRDTLAQLANARAKGKPTVLIPLYEDMDRYLVPAMKTDLLFRYLAMKRKVIPLEQIAKVREGFELEEHPLDNPFARAFGIGDNAKQREILEGVDCILTSGAAESESIRKKFGSALPPMREMHYGFNPAYSIADGTLFASKHGLKDFALCVGRLEPRKNQWQLIEVFRSLPRLQLVLVGRFSDPSMEPLIKAFAPPNVRFIERLPFEELVSAYAAARLHVLPSWYELPGLVSLEAAAAGCRVVSTDWGTAPDYLCDKVSYCSPDDPLAIRKAVLEAYDSDLDPALKQFVMDRFSWRNAAARCLQVYRQVLEGR